MPRCLAVPQSNTVAEVLWVSTYVDGGRPRVGLTYAAFDNVDLQVGYSQVFFPSGTIKPAPTAYQPVQSP